MYSIPMLQKKANMISWTTRVGNEWITLKSYSDLNPIYHHINDPSILHSLLTHEEHLFEHIQWKNGKGLCRITFLIAFDITLVTTSIPTVTMPVLRIASNVRFIVRSKHWSNNAPPICLRDVGFQRDWKIIKKSWIFSESITMKNDVYLWIVSEKGSSRSFFKSPITLSVMSLESFAAFTTRPSWLLRPPVVCSLLNVRGASVQLLKLMAQFVVAEPVVEHNYILPFSVWM